MKKLIDYSSAEITNNRNRTILTLIIVSAGILLIALLAMIIILLAADQEKLESAKWVFNAIIPLIASWIGTVIAFYFGRENFESATRQAMALTREALDDIQVENIMINVKTIVYRKIDEADDAKSSLNSIINLYKDIDKDRIPIFSSLLKPRFIIQKSTMIDYINSKQNTKPDLNLKDMIADNPKKFTFETSEGFVVVLRTNTVEEALNKMNSVKGCQDVIITDNGKETGEVIGWLTNTMINRFLTTR
jgi:uncharacterized integral membrane protein/methyl coenzyme M reductase subunit D